MLSGGPLSILATLVALGRMPSTPSPSISLTGLTLSRLWGGGGRGGRLFLFSDFELLTSTWNSPPVPSALIVNDIGTPAVTGVDDGDSDTAMKDQYYKYNEMHVYIYIYMSKSAKTVLSYHANYKI